MILVSDWRFYWGRGGRGGTAGEALYGVGGRRFLFFFPNGEAYGISPLQDEPNRQAVG